MKPHKQKNRHKPEEGVYGDCFRTVIACLLDADSPEDVPHVYEDGYDQNGHVVMNAWLRKTHGLVFVEIPFQSETLEELLKSAGMYTEDTHYSLMGQSKTGCNHLVVCRGATIVHDPSLNGSGIVGPTEEGHYWIGFLAKDV